MANINIEVLKDKLYLAAKSLFIISETLVDVSKQHISAENAINKIRYCMHDTDVIGSRYRVDKLIEECMIPKVYNIFEDKEKHWIEKSLKNKTDLKNYMYYIDDIEVLKSDSFTSDIIAQAVERTKKYIKE